VKAKVSQLSAEDIKILQEGEFKKLLETGIEDHSNSPIQRLKTGQIKQLLEAKIKSRVPEAATELLEEEFPNLGLNGVKKLLSEFKKALEPKARKAFAKAQEEFQKVVEVDPKNKAADLHVKRLRLYEHSDSDFPDVLNWDGVYVLSSK
jgi:adenylate cyclase